MSYEVGIGMYDCTGPAAEQYMMGYAHSDQKTAGIADRQWVRAFIIKDKKGNYICLAVADICMVFQAVKNEVMKKLPKRICKILNLDNLMLSTTHNHSGPAGYSYYPMYNFSSKGFCKQTFEAIVNGYAQAIIRAWNNMQPAKIYVNISELSDCGGQRSREAWESNPKEERDRYGDTDKSITMMKFIDASGKLIGLITYFASHTTSLGMHNHLISSDYRGYASRVLERKFGNDPYRNNPNFIAAFPNANCGDISPNVGLGHPPGGEEDYRRMKVIGDKLSNKTLEMINSECVEIKGDIRFGQTNVDLSNVQIDGTDRKTCDGALGASFTAASSEDSTSPMPTFIEGLTRSEFLAHDVSRKHSFRYRILTFFLDLIWHDIDDPEWVKAQGEKPIFLPICKIKFRGTAFFPSIFPFQIFNIGTVSIVGFPGEMTSIAGIRLKNTVLNEFRESEVNCCVLSCNANSHSSYTATKEEYNQQHYEGASTLFGPNQLEAIQQEYRKMAVKMRDNKIISPGIPFPKDPTKFKRFKLHMRFDDDPMGKDYGDVLIQPKSSYKCEEKVKVEFIGANPRNNLRTMDTFLEVQRYNNGTWETVFRDLDFETVFHWKRKRRAHSYITIEWNIPKNEKPGIYRIVYNGDAKSRWSKKITPYVGTSNSFEVLNT